MLAVTAKAISVNGLRLCVRLVATTQLPSLHKVQCHQMTQNPCYKLAAVN